MKYNSKKYRHIGYSYPSVPDGWKNIVEETIVEIEKNMWPRWIPMFIKRWIHDLATGGSSVRIRSRFWNKLRNILTKGQIINDIKDKFAGLRIYGNFGSEIEKIIEKAEDECYRTCEKCGGNEKVRTVGKGWISNLCKFCR
jgi:hypothetical protein